MQVLAIWWMKWLLWIENKKWNNPTYKYYATETEENYAYGITVGSHGPDGRHDDQLQEFGADNVRTQAEQQRQKNQVEYQGQGYQQDQRPYYQKLLKNALSTEISADDEVRKFLKAIEKCKEE